MSENRLAALSIIVEDRSESGEINRILAENGDFVVGRMGIPYRQRGVSVICVVLDAPTEILNSITGKIGNLNGVTARVLVSKL